MTNPTDALAEAKRFYVHEYGVAARFDPVEALERIDGKRGGAWTTLAELNALEHAGLAFGYHVKAADKRPGLTPLGREAIAEASSTWRGDLNEHDSRLHP